VIRVAVLDDYQGRAPDLADWTSLGPETEVAFFRRAIPADELADALADFQVVVLMRERTALPRSVLERLTSLRLVVTTGERNAALDVGYLRERGIPVSGTRVPPRRAGVSPAVEVAWALILATAKRVVIEDRAIRAGAWQLGFPALLAGATLGLAGLGRLGSQMVAPARAFGMTVIAWSPHLSPERADAAGAELVGRDELLRRSDVLSVHLVLSESTRGLIGEEEFAAMKRGAVLINTSRGPIVDEPALIRAVSSGVIGGAGLDVYDREPLPAGHPLRSADGIVLLPHVGYVSEDNFRVMYGQVVENIAAFGEGTPIRLIS
jgi:phosphoglycerate dehydrogenase-like enzyme